jgi:hypothetical protein
LEAADHDDGVHAVRASYGIDPLLADSFRTLRNLLRQNPIRRVGVRSVFVTHGVLGAFVDDRAMVYIAANHVGHFV